jgi:hypothetical protein
MLSIKKGKIIVETRHSWSWFCRYGIMIAWTALTAFATEASIAYTQYIWMSLKGQNGFSVKAFEANFAANTTFWAILNNL